MSDVLTLHVPARLDAIGPAGKAAEAWVAGQQASDEAVYLASLAIEELVTNCIKYGSADDREHTVQIDLSAANNQLQIVVIDDGRPFIRCRRRRPI